MLKMTKVSGFRSNSCRYGRCRRNHSSLQRRKLESDANRCCGGDRRHDCAAGGLFFCAGDNPCSDSQIHPFKSGITAVLGLFLGKNLQRLPSLTPEIRNHCSSGVVAFCRWNHSPLPLRKLESDAEHRFSRSVAAVRRRNHPPFAAT